MPRSLKKGPYINRKLLQKMRKVKSKDEIIKTWDRAATIVPEMVGYTFGVYNGKEFIPVKVREEMVGHRLGEFAPTTKFVRHGGRMERELSAREKESERESK